MINFIACLTTISTRYILFHTGAKLNIKNPTTVKPPPKSDVFERLFKENDRLTAAQINELAKKHEVSAPSISQWWKRRRAQNKEKTLTKFCESSWKMLYHMSIFMFGLWNVWNQPYFWNFDKTMENWPHDVSEYVIISKLFISSTFLIFYRKFQRA